MSTVVKFTGQRTGESNFVFRIKIAASKSGQATERERPKSKAYKRADRRLQEGPDGGGPH